LNSNIAIFPGTFNPIHIGHLMIADTALIQFGLDKIVFIVSPNPPNKLNSKEFLSINKRVELVESAIQSNKAFETDLRELKREGPSFTIDTVLEMKAEKKVGKLHFILGLDSFLSLPSWQKAKELGESCKFLVAPRPGWLEIDVADSLSSFHDDLDWALIDSPPLAISSTLIRTRKQTGLSYRYLMPNDEVFEKYNF
jgi:nicotinate-nucleotide adenylyltransferase